MQVPEGGHAGILSGAKAILAAWKHSYHQQDNQL